VSGRWLALSAARHVEHGDRDPDVHRGAPAESRAVWEKVRGVLVRPDGHVAWASEEADDDVLRSVAAAAVAAARRLI
jgi:aromatic ring hydroxylase-like protein